MVIISDILVGHVIFMVYIRRLHTTSNFFYAAQSHIGVTGCLFTAVYIYGKTCCGLFIAVVAVTAAFMVAITTNNMVALTYLLTW